MVAQIRTPVEKGPRESEYVKRNKISPSNRKFSFKKDLVRFIKWPKYIRIQRQRRIFCQKLKIPPAVYQFSKTLDKNMTNQLFQLLSNYKLNETKKDGKSLKKSLEKKNLKIQFQSGMVSIQFQNLLKIKNLYSF